MTQPTRDPQPRRPEIAPLAEGLRAQSLTAALTEDGRAESRTAAFTRTVEAGFYEPWMTDAEVDRWVEAHIQDGQQLTAVHVDRDAAAEQSWGPALAQLGFSAEHPVGTFVEYDKTLNTGGTGPEGALVPARLITEVTVDPSFRRRGILKHLMTRSLAGAVDDAMPVALLTASEGGIYGRFGFGVATREARIEVDLGLGSGEDFRLRTPATGRVLRVDPEKLGGVIDEVWDAFHGSTRGSVDRQVFYRNVGTGAWDPEDITSRNRKLRASVHVREDGTVGGYVTYRHEGWETEPSTIRVHDLIAVDAVSRIELWRHLADLDIVRRAVMRAAPVEDVLPSALADPRSCRVVGIRDVLWVRILDVVRALENRAWSADGLFIFEVSDSLGIIEGTYRVQVDDGIAHVESLVGEHDLAEEAPRIRVSAETLGSLYLGDSSVHTLHAAGRIEAAGEDVLRISQTMDLPTRPHCATHF